MPIKYPDELAIARASDAAIECVAAVQSFLEAATARQQSIEDDEDGWRNHDYRPYIARLYRALQAGVDRMCEVWPQIKEVYRLGDPAGPGMPRGEMKHPSIFSPHLAVPVQAWMFANAVLFGSMDHYSDDNSCHWNVMVNAWHDRNMEYVPDLSDYPNGDITVWQYGLAEAKNFSWAWEEWIAAIRTAPPTALEDNSPADRTVESEFEIDGTEQQLQSTPLEPTDGLVTMEEMAKLASIDNKDTLDNRLREKQVKPKPEVSHSGRTAARFSYERLRAAVAKAYPDRERMLPKTYAEADKELRWLVRGQSDGGPPEESRHSG